MKKVVIKTLWPKTTFFALTNPKILITQGINIVFFSMRFAFQRPFASSRTLPENIPMTKHLAKIPAAIAPLVLGLVEGINHNHSEFNETEHTSTIVETNLKFLKEYLELKQANPQEVVQTLSVKLGNGSQLMLSTDFRKKAVQIGLSNNNEEPNPGAWIEFNDAGYDEDIPTTLEELHRTVTLDLVKHRNVYYKHSQSVASDYPEHFKIILDKAVEDTISFVDSENLISFKHDHALGEAVCSIWSSNNGKNPETDLRLIQLFSAHPKVAVFGIDLRNIDALLVKLVDKAITPATKARPARVVNVHLLADLLRIDSLELQTKFWEVLTPEVFNSCNKKGVDFSGAIFAGRNMAGFKFDGIDLRNANFENAQFFNIEFVNSDLSGSNFQKAKFKNVTIFNSNFANANFKQAKLAQSQFVGNSDFSQACFSQSKMIDLLIANCTMQSAQFRGIHIQSTEFNQNNLHGAQFDSDADAPFPTHLFMVEFIDNNLSAAQFHKVRLSQTRFIGQQEQKPNDAHYLDLSDAHFTESDFINVEFNYTNMKKENIVDPKSDNFIFNERNTDSPSSS